MPGTPAYMAPEQQRADPGDARSDQYSYCVTLYEALYGERPLDRSLTAIGADALVLHDLDAHVRAGRLVVSLDRRRLADVEAHRGVELERVAAGGRLGVARPTARP